MNLELKNGIILAVIASIFGVIGFFGAQHFQAETKKADYKLKLTEKLYEKNYKSTRELIDSASNFISIFGNGFGLTSKEIQKPLDKFNTSLKAYNDHVLELKRLGTSEQIEVAKNILDWAYSIRMNFQLQHDSAANVENRAYELLNVDKESNEELFNFVNEALDSEIERLVQSENRIYYSEGTYKIPVIRSLEQYLNYYFRTELGLEATKDMSDSIKNLPEKIKASNAFEFTEKLYPFSFAAQRQVFSPELSLKNMGEIMSDKDKYLKQQIKLKFLAEAIVGNKELQEKLSSQTEKKTNK